MSTIDAYETKAGRRWRVIYRKPGGAQTGRRGFQRKRDAEEWLAEHVTVAKASGSFIDPAAGKRKVGDLWPAWIGKKRISSKASYIESLERAWRVHVEPQWAGRPVGSPGRAEIQEWVSKQAGEKSATVVLRNLGILRGICDDAVADRLIQSNPCDGVETPKKKRKDHVYLTAPQLFRLADEAKGRRTLVLVLGLCGLRWGEMAGLHVEDVDFIRHRLSVKRSATTVGRKVVIDLPKNGRPRRSVREGVQRVADQQAQQAGAQAPFARAGLHHGRSAAHDGRGRQQAWHEALESAVLVPRGYGSSARHRRAQSSGLRLQLRPHRARSGEEDHIAGPQGSDQNDRALVGQEPLPRR